MKNSPAVWETWVWSLGREDPLEKGLATHARILAWRIPWTEEPGRLQSKDLQRVQHNWGTFTWLNLLVLGFPGDSAVNYLSAVQETRVWSLGWEDPLEEGMATNSSILTWREEPGRLQSMGSQRVGHDWSDSAPPRPPSYLLPAGACEVIYNPINAGYLSYQPLQISSATMMENLKLWSKISRHFIIT